MSHDYTTHYIDGEWREAAAPGLPVIDSSTGKPFATVPNGNAEEMGSAVEAARQAFPMWAALPLEERKAALTRVLEKYQEKKPQLIECLQRELGCTATFAKNVQVIMVDLHFKTALNLVDTVKFEEVTKGARIVKEPIGVVGCITPWNYPLNQISCKVGPALLVGCTVVLKPSEVTPICAYLFAEAIHEAGLPKGVFNMVMGGAACGQALVEHPEVDMISFTGSTRAGRQITQAAANTLKVVRTELGGKSAALLLDDADFAKDIPNYIKQLANNSGQSCNALSRMLVPTSRYEEAIDIAKKAMENVVVGRPSDKSSTIGPVISQTQWDKIQEYITLGIKENARLVVGGLGKPAGLEDGFFVKPTIFADVKNNFTIAQEEIFGPVLSVIPYETEEEGINIANDTVYGLDGAVSSVDHERALRVARKIRSGSVMINGAAHPLHAPFGGYKQSGNAREWGAYGIEEYLLTKSILLSNM